VAFHGVLEPGHPSLDPPNFLTEHLSNAVRHVRQRGTRWLRSYRA
jgi:hypothetical protein